MTPRVASLGMRLALLALLLTPTVLAAPVCQAGTCAGFDGFESGAGSCDATTSAYFTQRSVVLSTSAGGGWTQVVIAQGCSRTHDADGRDPMGSTDSRSTGVWAYRADAGGDETNAAAGWYEYGWTGGDVPPYRECNMWAQVDADYEAFGCPAGSPPPTLLPLLA